MDVIKQHYFLLKEMSLCLFDSRTTKKFFPFVMGKKRVVYVERIIQNRFFCEGCIANSHFEAISYRLLTPRK
ncbi:hypothetical protein CDAR_260121 [Caerostris darwini]|uniref:Uncharacterized protein n=1 Tax=Caerostris darwini TaxID=1538125 RepID=A0AAV4V9L3_9ARAC|nr:hypothetical protein CDAR_260121 [Caerostris darwini]